MPNNYFRFKQFTIHQDECAMKVCTDSCLFGAWVSQFLLEHQGNYKRILDIGTGTGLLSLQLAQKNDSSFIDGLEIDKKAANQASENFAGSPWKDRLQVHHGRIQEYIPNYLYDVIICNPPFYNNSLKGGNTARNTAHHSTDISLDELLSSIERLINKTGFFAVLLPYHRSIEWKEMCKQKGFYLTQETLVKQTEKHNFFRSMQIFSCLDGISLQNEISIKNSENEYTVEFKELLKDYYLAL